MCSTAYLVCSAGHIIMVLAKTFCKQNVRPTGVAGLGPYRLTVRTPAFQAVNRGSIPRRVTTQTRKTPQWRFSRCDPTRNTPACVSWESNRRRYVDKTTEPRPAVLCFL